MTDSSHMSSNVDRLVKMCEAVIRPVTSRPEDLVVVGEREYPSKTIRLTIICSHFDFPRIMGREGRNHNALKMITSIAAATLGESTTIFVQPPQSKFQAPKVEFVPQPEAALDGILKSLEQVANLVFHGRTQIAHRSEGHTSWIDVKVDPKEKLTDPVIDALAKELRILVHAQGKSIGRVVYVFVKK